MIYEFRTYALKPRSLAEVEKRFGEAYEYRKKYSPLTAFWHTEIGPLNEIIHVWGYRDLAERARVRAEAAKESNWPPKIRDFVVDQAAEGPPPRAGRPGGGPPAFPVRARDPPGREGPHLRDPPLQPDPRCAARRDEALGRRDR